MRLDKAATLAGLTRSEARRAIAAGRARVEGVAVTDPATQVRAEDVTIDGRGIEAGELYLMIHKPAGVVTATRDGRAQCVADLLPEALRRRAPGPVGRLDRDVTGLVLMTTDGQLAHRLISPRWKAEKTYVAACQGRLTDEDVRAFARGIELHDFTARPAGMTILEANEESSLAEVKLTEGRFHQVKRMFAAIGHPLTALRRTRIGPVKLDETLSPGEYRVLTEDEVDNLKQCTGLK